MVGGVAALHMLGMQITVGVGVTLVTADRVNTGIRRRALNATENLCRLGQTSGRQASALPWAAGGATKIPHVQPAFQQTFLFENINLFLSPYPIPDTL